MIVAGASCWETRRASDPTLAPCCPRTADGVDTWTDAYDVGDVDDDVDRRLRQWTTTRTVDDRDRRGRGRRRPWTVNAYGSRL